METFISSHPLINATTRPFSSSSINHALQPSINECLQQSINHPFTNQSLVPSIKMHQSSVNFFKAHAEQECPALSF
jgi:hypothetical protein